MPAVTRRQSGKLPPPRNPVPSISQHDEDDFMDGDLSDLEEPVKPARTRKRAAKKDIEEDVSEAEEGSNEEEDDIEDGVEEDDDQEYAASGALSSLLRLDLLGFFSV